MSAPYGQYGTGGGAGGGVGMDVQGGGGMAPVMAQPPQGVTYLCGGKCSLACLLVVLPSSMHAAVTLTPPSITISLPSIQQTAAPRT